MVKGKNNGKDLGLPMKVPSLPYISFPEIHAEEEPPRRLLDQGERGGRPLALWIFRPFRAGWIGHLSPGALPLALWISPRWG